MRKLLFVAVSLCSLVSFAVDPVAVWNGDLSAGSVKSDKYTMASDSSVVSFANGVASLAKTTSVQSKGVEISWADPSGDATLPQNQITVFVKYSGYDADAGNHALVAAEWGSTTSELVVYGTSDKNRIRAAHSVGTSDAGTQDKTDANGIQQAIPAEGILMVSLAGVTGDLSGTRVAIAARNGESYGEFTQYYYNSSYKFSSSKFYGLRIGGTQTGVDKYYRPQLTVEGVAIYAAGTTVADANTMKDSLFPADETPKSEPLMLLNLHKETPVEGWLNHTQPDGSTIPKSGMDALTTNGVTFATSDNGNFFNSNWTRVDSTFATGSYEDVFGDTHEDVLNELRASLGLPDDFAITEDVYKTGLMNGGTYGHTATVSGLLPRSMYVIYAGFGVVKDSTQCQGFKIQSSGYSSIDARDYVTTVQGVGTSVATSYQSFDENTTIRPGVQGLMIVRLKGVVPTEEGNVRFVLDGERAGINFLAVAKVNEAKPTTTTIDISGPTNYRDLETAGFTGVTLNLTANAELTFAEAVPDNVALTFTGAHDLTVKGAQYLTFAKVNDAAVSGKVSYEISGSYNASAGLINKIKDAGTNRTFIFAGSGNAGTTLRISTDNNTYLNKTLATHLVFDGGTHTLEIRSENAGLKFGSSATVENPTVYVKGNAVLTFHARNLCGWTAGAADKTGVIRIDDGSSVNLVPTEGTLYWTQMIYLQPGATLNFTDNNATDPKLRIAGGTSEANAQIVVPETTAGNAKKAMIKQLGSAPIWAKIEGTEGFAISVGANAVLEFDAALNGPSAVSKYGAGTLVMKRAVSAPMTVAAGMIGGSASVESLSLRDGAGLAVDSSAALTVTGTLSIPNPVTIAGVLENDMVVVTVPADYEATGATATDGSRTYELTRSGNELLLVYLIPPSRSEGTDLTVTPSAVDGVSDSVSIVVPGLNEGDYAGMVTYTLNFGGEKTVSGTYADGAIVFAFPDELKVGGQVLRGELTATFDTDQALSLGPVTVYQGQRQFVWTPEGELWVDETPTTKGATGTWTDGLDVANGKLVVKAASGVAFTPTANPDYIETCDSTFTVSISAAEAVDAASDPAPEADVQGGVRIASVNGVLKVQVLANGAWTDLKASGVEPDTDYAVEVAFHYAKPGVEDDRDTVTYTLDGVTVTGEKVRDTVAKISTVAVADGTQLAFLKGVCQLDKAVVVDVAVEIEHDENKPIDAKDLAAAQAVADKMVVAISDEVAKVVDATTYRGYFKVVAKPGEDGQFHATVAFAPGVQKEIEDDIQAAMEKVVAGLETGRAEIAAKPGLYYGLKRGDKLGNLSIQDKLTLAGADGKVTIAITKPEGATKHFYRIVCLPTPAEPAK